MPRYLPKYAVSMNLSDIAHDVLSRAFNQNNRPERLHFSGQHGKLFEGALLPHRTDITSGVCDDTTAHITCLTTRSDLPLKELLGLPIEVQFVTDVGQLQRCCVVITDVCQGQSDGSLTAIQLTGRDIFAVMEGRRSNRIYLNKSVLDIARLKLDSWRRRDPALAQAFDYLLLNIDESLFPPRALHFQCHQSDADFLRGLFRRNGIAWFVRAMPSSSGDNKSDNNDTPAQQLVLFTDARELAENSAGPIKYHRRDGTEKRDTISLLAPAYTLVSGAVTRSSFDHETAHVDVASEASAIDQGSVGNEIAAALVDARIELPHVGDTWADHQRLTRIDMARHEGRAHCLHGIGGVRAQGLCEWNRIDGHPLLDALSPEQREYITIRLQIWAEGSLPKDLNERAQALMRASEAGIAGWAPPPEAAPQDGEAPGSEHRFTNRFIAVRRDSPITPSWNPETDLPHMPLMTATVISEDGQPVLCDEHGRVKVRIHGLDPVDEEGQTTDTTAWVRVNFLWCGDGFGIIFPLRPGMEVSLGFEMGDASRPMIVGSRYNHDNPPPRFDHLGSLPKNAAESGIVTRELNGTQQSQLRFIDSTGNVSVQLGTDHAATQINIGNLATPMNEGQTEPRGEGLEARTKAALATRGEQGVYITADALPGERSPALERSPLIGLTEVLQSIQQQLAQLASTHQTGSLDGSKLSSFIRHLRDWEHGSNTAPTATGGGMPMVVATAPSTVAIASGDNLVLGAQSNIDAVSAGNTHLTAGQNMLLHAGEGFSVFAHAKGIKMVTAQDDINIESHAGKIVLTAAKQVVLRAGEEIVLEAPKIRQVTQGAQVDVGGGQIVQQSSGAHVIKSSSFAQTSGGGGSVAGLNLPSTVLKTDERVQATYIGSGEPRPGQHYTAFSTADGRQLGSGVTDAEGYTEAFKGVSIETVRIVIHPEGGQA